MNLIWPHQLYFGAKTNEFDFQGNFRGFQYILNSNISNTIAMHCKACDTWTWRRKSDLFERKKGKARNNYKYPSLRSWYFHLPLEDKFPRRILNKDVEYGIVFVGWMVTVEMICVI